MWNILNYYSSLSSPVQDYYHFTEFEHFPLKKPAFAGTRRLKTFQKKTENYSILNSEWLGYSTDKR